MTKKEKDEVKLRQHVICLLIVPLLFFGGLFIVMSGEINNSNLLISVGFVCLVASIVFLILLIKRIRYLQKRIEHRCPECGSMTLDLLSETHQDTGKTKVVYTSAMRYEDELVSVTKKHKCITCGYTKVSIVEETKIK